MAEVINFNEMRENRSKGQKEEPAKAASSPPASEKKPDKPQLSAGEELKARAVEDIMAHLELAMTHLRKESDGCSRVIPELMEIMKELRNHRDILRTKLR